MTRETVSIGMERENRASCSRTVRVGNDVRVSGITATDENGEIVGVDDPLRTTRRTLENIESTVESAGTSLEVGSNTHVCDEYREL